MSAISEVFARCQQEKRAAFIPYITAGDPDLRTTVELVGALERGGADLIELGVPFSDPIADGPANQRSAVRALEGGVSLNGIFRAVARCREQVTAPILLFTYFNPIHARGVERFAEQAATSGVDGVLCLDLPPEEAQETYLQALQDQGLDTVFLLAPTSTRARVKAAAEASTGFLYYVSRTGVTGSKEPLPKELAKQVKSVRRRVRMPVAVGFGISSPEQVQAVGRIADGVVVGSALVRLIEESSGRDDLPEILEARVRELAAPLRQKASR